MGFSLGGYLAPRAAAFEPRVKRVIAIDVLADFFAASIGKAGPELAARIEELVNLGEAKTVNAILAQMAEHSETVGWAIAHGAEICGAEDGFGYLKWLQDLRTAPFSNRITQDFLLMGAQEDHIVPISQWYDQIFTLRNVKSLTAQLFTRADDAHTHCHVGNTPLILDFVITWLNFQLRAEEARKALVALD
jgi:pimeloyl-ACP methyl ester carboxylesterase